MSTTNRIQHDFPSRKYAYSKQEGVASFDVPVEASLQRGKTYRFILGRDHMPLEISPDECKSLLTDPFAQLILFGGRPLPLSLRTLLAELDRFNTDTRGLPEQSSFVVADGGQIPWTPETDTLNRAFRLAITRRRAGASEPDVLISGSTALDSTDAFLQVIGWDPVHGAAQFYERRMGAWVWAGSSWDALQPDSRGKGPFDSHVNGALNMKELKRPWLNWHSQAASIRDEVLSLTDPLRSEPIWTSRNGAEEFERAVVRPGIQRWTASRFSRSTKDGKLERLPEFFRQVLETTTVNLISSTTSKAALQTASTVPLPLTFFVNSDALLDRVGLEPNISVPRVSAQIYRTVLDTFDVWLTDGTHRFKGDTHFVFVVPEAAFEDVFLLETLLAQNIVTPRFAACLLMVDFSNPVFSARRASLMRHVPAFAKVGGSEELSSAFARSAEQVGGPAEHEFLNNWRLPEPDWKKTFEARIEQFFDALKSQMDSSPKFARIFELAESRRREFRKRPLAEFRLTTPITNIPEDAPFLEVTPEGIIRNKS